MTRIERIQIPHVGVAEYPDLNVFLVAFAEDPIRTGKRIELQLALEFDQQDRDMGMDTYCISTSWGTTHYGGIDSLVLKGRTLMLGFEQAAAEVLELPRKVALDLKV